MKRLYQLFLLLFFLFLNLNAQEVDVYARPEHFERSRDYDVLHYQLALKINVEEKKFWGENAITLSPLKDGFNKCILDAESFNVNSVLNEWGIPLRFDQEAKHLIVYLSKTYNYGDVLSFTVQYYGRNPKKGLRFFEECPDNPALVASDSWPDGAHHWFPCYDFPNDKVTNDLIVTVDSNYKALSNGRLMSLTTDKTHNTSTYHWSQVKPHSTYLFVLAVAPYVVIKDSLGSLPVNYWVYKKDEKDAMRSFKKTPQMIDFYNKLFGYAYPWAKYDQAIIPFGGGAESTSATVLGHQTIHDERAEQDFSSEWLVAHELAHQWWGDLITKRTWAHAWLNESFATYFEYVWSRYDRGEDEGALNLLEKKMAYLNEAHTRYIRPIVFNRYKTQQDIYDRHSYQKGAIILHMLRFIIGEKLFFKTLRHFLHKHAFDVVDTHDFMKAIKEVTGRNLDWFFEQWLFKPGHPIFNVSYTWDEETGKLKLQILQRQDTSKGIPIYKTPVVIGIITAERKVSEKVWLQKREEEFEFLLERKPLMVRFDEGNFLMKEWAFNKRLEELLYQLRNDDVIGRMWAASELMKFKDNPEAIANLEECAKNDPFWGVRKSAVEGLGKIRKEEHIELLKRKCEESHSKVRTTALKALGDFRESKLIDFFKERFNKDSSYFAQAEALRAMSKCGEKTLRPFLEEATKMNSPRDVIKKAAEWALDQIDKN